MLIRQLGSSFVFSLNLNPDLRVFAYAMALSLVAGIALQTVGYFVIRKIIRIQV